MAARRRRINECIADLERWKRNRENHDLDVGTLEDTLGLLRELRDEDEKPVETLARAFAEMESRDQALFFKNATVVAEEWENPGEHQWAFIGSALRREGFEEARDMISTIAACMGLKESPDEPPPATRGKVAWDDILGDSDG